MSKKPIEEQTQPELVAYIRDHLRPELQQRREAFEKYEAAFSGMSDVDRRGMLHVVKTFSENRKEGAELFRGLSNSVLGEPETTQPPQQEEEIMTEENTTNEPAPSEEAPAWAQKLIVDIDELKAAQVQSMESEKAAHIADLKSTARTMGFTEGTEAWTEFFKIAGSELANGDLNVAKDMYVKLHGEITAGGEEGGEPTTDVVEAAAEVSTEFPKTGAAGGSGAPGVADEGGEGLDLTNKSAVNDAAAAYIANFGDDSATTP